MRIWRKSIQTHYKFVDDCVRKIKINSLIKNIDLYHLISSEFFLCLCTPGGAISDSMFIYHHIVSYLLENSMWFITISAIISFKVYPFYLDLKILPQYIIYVFGKILNKCNVCDVTFWKLENIVTSIYGYHNVNRYIKNRPRFYLNWFLSSFLFDMIRRIY